MIPLPKEFKQDDRKPELKQPKEDHSGIALELFSEAVRVNQDRINDLIQLDKQIVEILREVSRPKPKRNFVSTVNRDGSGKITMINTEEK